MQSIVEPSYGGSRSLYAKRRMRVHKFSTFHSTDAFELHVYCFKNAIARAPRSGCGSQFSRGTGHNKTMSRNFRHFILCHTNIATDAHGSKLKFLLNV